MDIDDLEMDMLTHRHDQYHPISELYQVDQLDQLDDVKMPVSGVNARTSKRVKCKYCGNENLRWKSTADGWRTFEEGALHKCPIFDRKVTPSASDRPAACSMDESQSNIDNDKIYKKTKKTKPNNMTQSRVKELLPIFEAFANGDTVEHYTSYKNGWVEVNDPSFTDDAKNYRIKPKPVEGWVIVDKKGWFVSQLFTNEHNANLQLNRHQGEKVVHMVGMLEKETN